MITPLNLLELEADQIIKIKVYYSVLIKTTTLEMRTDIEALHGLCLSISLID